jgi:hypothetical protein
MVDRLVLAEAERLGVETMADAEAREELRARWSRKRIEEAQRNIEEAQRNHDSYSRAMETAREAFGC